MHAGSASRRHTRKSPHPGDLYADFHLGVGSTDTHAESIARAHRRRKMNCRRQRRGRDALSAAVFVDDLLNKARALCFKTGKLLHRRPYRTQCAVSIAVAEVQCRELNP